MCVLCFHAFHGPRKGLSCIKQQRDWWAAARGAVVVSGQVSAAADVVRPRPQTA